MPHPIVPYDQIGGEAVVRKLVDTFYDLMDSVPEFHVIRKLHPELLTGSREKLYMFLTGWLGGPQLYVEKFGHPKLRARHLGFSIGLAERDAWLACMQRAMDQCGIEQGLQAGLMGSLYKTADWMRNTEPASG